MGIHISDSSVNKDYIHKGIHRLTLSFKGDSKLNGDDVKLLLRSKNPELVCFLVDGYEQNEMRFSEKFNNLSREFEQVITVRQLFTPDTPAYAGFLISGRNQNGNTTSEEFVIQCK